jgi:hypothetical protein
MDVTRQAECTKPDDDRDNLGCSLHHVRYFMYSTLMKYNVYTRDQVCFCKFTMALIIKVTAVLNCRPLKMAHGN